MTRIDILIRGRLAGSTAGLIADRFDGLAIDAPPHGDTRIAGVMDQATERALLALLWDTGHEVVSMRSISTTGSIPTTGGDDE